jgi:hypothetical protein
MKGSPTSHCVLLSLAGNNVSHDSAAGMIEGDRSCNINNNRFGVAVGPALNSLYAYNIVSVRNHLLRKAFAAARRHRSKMMKQNSTPFLSPVRCLSGRPSSPCIQKLRLDIKCIPKEFIRNLKPIWPVPLDGLKIPL